MYNFYIMLDLKEIIKNPEEYKARLAQKKVDTKLVDEILSLAAVRSEVMTKLQSLEAERNKLSKEIGLLKSKGQSADEVMARVAEIKSGIEQINGTEKEVNDKITSLLLVIPNVTLPSVPFGKDDSENVIIAKHVIGRGEVAGVKSHYDIAEALDIVEFERAVKLSGTRF